MIIRYYIYLRRRQKKNNSNSNDSIVVNSEPIEYNNKKKDQLQITKNISLNLNTKDESKLDKVESIDFFSIVKDGIKDTEINNDLNTYRSTNNNIETETKVIENKQYKSNLKFKL